ncbi:MAG: DNA-binding HxlR family transcriptional regulator, partial [Salibacteraceae bacterium]
MYFYYRIESKSNNYYRINSNSLYKMKKEFRSGCPICSALDVVGDKWSLLI